MIKSLQLSSIELNFWKETFCPKDILPSVLIWPIFVQLRFKFCNLILSIAFYTSFALFFFPQILQISILPDPRNYVVWWLAYMVLHLFLTLLCFQMMIAFPRCLQWTCDGGLFRHCSPFFSSGCLIAAFGGVCFCFLKWLRSNFGGGLVRYRIHFF